MILNSGEAGMKKASAWIKYIILFVEVIQFLFGRGSFDIDDIILNMVGIFIGYVIWKFVPAFCHYDVFD